MSAQVEFLFRGSHPAFFWAAAMLRKKKKSVALFPYPEAHSWECLPSEVVTQLDLQSFKSNRDQSPIQILTRERRLGIFSDLMSTQKDFLLCTGNEPSPELKRGLAFYAKGSDYPAVFGETSAALIEACHEMEYFEEPPSELKKHAFLHLKKIGVEIVRDEHHFPLAEQTVILDLNRACVFRSKFEISVPAVLPTGGSRRMLYVERNAPVIELLYGTNHESNREKGILRLRTLLPETPSLVERMLAAIKPLFPEANWSSSDVKVAPQGSESYEWGEAKSNVDASKPGIWLVSPALNPELGERSLYVRLSDLLAKKYKKQQLFEVKDLFAP